MSELLVRFRVKGAIYMTYKYSAAEIIEAIKGKATDEQLQIIESGLEPAVVIAGAGSGKTETMANRTLFLLANQIVKPDEILGLTFTRKAAFELRQRIKKRLSQLIAAGILPKNYNTDVPVMTYHAYAGALISEYGLRIGIDSDAQLVGEAHLWQEANKLIRNWPDENFEYQSAISTLIDDVLGLTKNVLEHGVDLNAISDHHEKELAILKSLKPGLAKENSEIEKVIQVLTQRLKIIPIVKAFIESRSSGEFLAYDDQMSAASKLAVLVPEVKEIERTKYKVVLLDEYQDTSQSQVRMLSALFGQGHPVTAVGDPYQAIYGWRGAAIGTIKNFARDFNCEDKKFSLSTTFRNDLEILDLANEIAEVVSSQTKTEVGRLAPRNDATKGLVVTSIFEDSEMEAIGIAEHLAPIWSGASSAVLVRNRKQIPIIESALHRAGLPVEVIGIGGLMAMPEVVDIFTLLKVITDPDAGADLMRHLSGPRLNIGSKDIAALGKLNKNKNRHNSRNIISELTTSVVEVAEADDLPTGSLIETLDEIENVDPKVFSKVGYSRLLAFSKDLRKLRSRASGSLVDLIYEIEEYLHLSVELEFRDNGLSGRRHVERFIEEAAKFASNSARDFINWLEVAVKKERGLEAGSAQVKDNVIQILTVHMAKGLEWDHVVIPGLAEGQFPSENNKKSISWLHSENEIPFNFRGDSAEFPEINFNAYDGCASAAKGIIEFKNNCAKLRLNEEWRLAYVAITRAKKSILASFSYWGEHKSVDEPSELMKLIHKGEMSEPKTNSADRAVLGAKESVWPVKNSFDFDKVLEIYAKAESSPKDLDSELLIKKSKLIESEIKLPDRISVSTMVALKNDPQSVISNIRRPMPFLQDKFMRRGTQFHEWVEKYLKAETLFDDSDLDYYDKIESDIKLTELQEKWLKSEWAEKKPFDLEVPFETVIAGVLIRGRIDAIYKDGDEFEVVDWKTGSTKLGEAEAIQLAVYRLAWAKISGANVNKIKAAFHYVPTGETDRRSNLLTEAELTDLITKHR